MRAAEERSNEESLFAWTCPTCGQGRHARYCADCGERALHAHDLTLFGLIEQAVEAVTHLDGRVFHTFRCLLTRPGMLTESYVRGQRKPTLGPLQVFLIANVVFFAFQSAVHSNVFSNPLDSQLHKQFYKTVAARLVGARLNALHTTEELYAPAFDHAVVVNAKSLIILMTPPMALLAGLLFYARGRPFVTHVVFAIHFYAFWLILFCVIAPIVGLPIFVLTMVRGSRLPPSAFDTVATYTLLGIAMAYLYVAAGRVYGSRIVLGRLVKVVLLAVTAGFTIIGYRFVVFLITLYTTGSH